MNFLFIDKLIGTGYTGVESLITESEMYEKWKAVFLQDMLFYNMHVSVLTAFSLFWV